MQYLSAAEAAKKWKISTIYSYINLLHVQGQKAPQWTYSEHSIKPVNGLEYGGI